MTDYFSYEQFYVVYCKFWEIDQDHDLLISREDLSKHADRALPQLVVERIFSRAVTRGTRGGENTKLDVRRLTDFTTFLLADEDKKHPTSIEYWFRVMDLDGDGVISFYEMELFYDDLKKKLDECTIETMSFVDFTCYLIDMINPSSQSGFKLSDLKKSHLAVRFFNSFVNWRKFYEQEATEGEKATLRGQGEEEISDWDKYCLEEYENLIEDDIDENFDVNLDEEDNNIIKEEVLSSCDSQSSCDLSLIIDRIS